MLEADLKRQIEDYLTIMEAQGSCVWDRLNSGSILAMYGETKRRIKLCRPGTADLIVLQKHIYTYRHYEEQTTFENIRVIYLEVKRPGKHQNDDQKAFQSLVEAQGAEYHVVHDADEVQGILKGRQ